MYRDNNSNYIIVDAYSDGFLKEKQDFEIFIDNDHITINSLYIEPKVQTVYIDKYRAFLANQNKGKKLTGTIRIKSTFKLADIENPESKFRRRSVVQPQIRVTNFNESCIDAIESEMEKDHLISFINGYSFYYKNGLVTVNGKPLPKALNKKYATHFKECQIDKNSQTASIRKTSSKIK